LPRFPSCASATTHAAAVHSHRQRFGSELNRRLRVYETRALPSELPNRRRESEILPGGLLPRVSNQPGESNPSAIPLAAVFTLAPKVKGLCCRLHHTRMRVEGSNLAFPTDHRPTMQDHPPFVKALSSNQLASPNAHQVSLGSGESQRLCLTRCLCRRRCALTLRCNLSGKGSSDGQNQRGGATAGTAGRAGGGDRETVSPRARRRIGVLRLVLCRPPERGSPSIVRREQSPRPRPRGRPRAGTDARGSRNGRSRRLPRILREHAKRVRVLA
jgi:hypothetical protein